MALKHMLPQKNLDHVSYVVANSLARNLAGVDRTVPIKVFKIGFTRKGQPWISYSVNGIKRSQFISRSLWDCSKKRLYVSYSVASFQRFSSSAKIALNFLTLSDSGSGYFGSFACDLSTFEAEVYCACEGFHYRKTCCHSSVIRLVGESIAKGIAGGKVSVVDNALVAASTSTVSTVPTTPTTPTVSAVPTTSTTAMKSLADRIWRDRSKVELSYCGKQYSAARVSLAETEDITTEANPKYQVIEAPTGNYLVEAPSQAEAPSQVQAPSQAQASSYPEAPSSEDYKVPVVIAAAHKKAKLLSQAKSKKAGNPYSSEIPDIFSKVEFLDIEWKKFGNFWKSSQGDEVEGALLKEVVRRQLLIGHNVLIRTTKNLYKCSISASGDVENTQISAR